MTWRTAVTTVEHVQMEQRRDRFERSLVECISTWIAMSTTLHRLLYRRLLRLGRQVDDSATLKVFLSRRPQEFYDRHTQMWMPFELDEDEVYRAEEISGFLGGSVHFNPFLRSNQESVEFSTLLKSQARNPNVSIERGFKVLGYLDELVNQGGDMIKERRGRLDDLVERLEQSLAIALTTRAKSVGEQYPVPLISLLIAEYPVLFH